MCKIEIMKDKIDTREQWEIDCDEFYKIQNQKNKAFMDLMNKKWE